MVDSSALSSGDPSSHGPDTVQVVRRFYSDWPTRPWRCTCGWVGRCEGRSTSEAPFPIVFRCPGCDAEVGWVDSPREGERSEADGVASVPLEMLDFWLQKLINEPFPGQRRFPGGAEDEILVRPDDWFFGVEKTWLLGRLRLDPAASPMDLEDRLGFQIYLDEDMIDIPDELPEGDFYTLLGSGSFDGALVTYGNGGIIGGRNDITGGWIQDWSPEIRNSFVWLGPDPDLHALATSYLSQGIEYWEPNENQLFEVTSPYLDASAPEDVDDVLLLSGDAGVVTLNGTVLRDRASDT